MIDSNTQPQQILVIDDNQFWLDSLAGLGIIVLNGRNKSHRDLVDFFSLLKLLLQLCW